MFRCADELFNFARSYEKLDCLTIFQPNEAQQDNDNVSEEDNDLISMMMTRMMTKSPARQIAKRTTAA